MDRSIYIEYCRLRNQVRYITRKAQIMQEKEIANNSKTTPPPPTTKYWSYTKSRTKSKSGISNLDYTDEMGSKKTADTDDQKANVLSTFFFSVFSNELKGDLPQFDKRNYNSMLKDVDCTAEVIHILFNMSLEVGGI